MDHLACFAAGMYGLAAHEEKDENSERWMEVAKVRNIRHLLRYGKSGKEIDTYDAIEKVWNLFFLWIIFVRV